MKTVRHYFILVYVLSSLVLDADTLRVKKDFLELKAGAVLTSHEWGKQYTGGPTYKAKGTLSETFSLGVGKCFKHFAFGFYFDYVKFNLVGETMRVGYPVYKSSDWTHAFNIYQKISFYTINSGITFYYHLKFRRFFLLAGPSIYFQFGTSPVTVRNYYAAEQPAYTGPRPTEGRIYKEPEQIFEKPIPVIGLNISVNYRLNKRWSLAIYGSFFYSELSLYHNVTTDLPNYWELPKGYLYCLREQSWLSSGLCLRYWF